MSLTDDQIRDIFNPEAMRKAARTVQVMNLPDWEYYEERMDSGSNITLIFPTVRHREGQNIFRCTSERDARLAAAAPELARRVDDLIDELKHCIRVLNEWQYAINEDRATASTITGAQIAIDRANKTLDTIQNI